MKRKKVFNKWGEVEQLIDNYNGVDILDIMDSWCFDKEKMITFIIVDNEYPIRMELSSKKITMPHSDLTSSGLFARTTKFHILGITNDISGIFTIKPLALWNIITKDECRKFVYGKNVKNGWNQASKSPKDLEVFFCPFLEESNFRNKQSMVQYPRSYQRDRWIIEKEQNTSHTQVSQI